MLWWMPHQSMNHRTYIPEHLQASGILYLIIRPSLHRASASGPRPRPSRRAFDSVEGGGIRGGCLDLSRRNRHFSRAQITSLTSQLPPIRHDATSTPPISLSPPICSLTRIGRIILVTSAVLFSASFLALVQFLKVSYCDVSTQSWTKKFTKLLAHWVFSWIVAQGEDMKSNPEMDKSAVRAGTGCMAVSPISGLCFMSSTCMIFWGLGR